MDRWATKDTYEREEEEAERLVRPAPKVKPPRDDKKREDVHERDPDTDGDPDLKGDPDMSLNYKRVGGSMAERVAEKWVRVKNKELDKGTRVRPETLEKEPGKYEKIPPNEPDPPDGKPRPARKPAKPHLKKDRPPHPPWPDPRPLPPDGPRPARPPKPVKPVPVPKVQEPEKEPKTKPPGWVKKRYKPAAVVGRFLFGKEFSTKEELDAYIDQHPAAKKEKHWVKGEEPDEGAEEEAPEADKPQSGPDALADAGYALREAVKDNPALEARLKDMLNPRSDIGGIADANPDYPSAAFFKGVKLPPGLEKLGDLVKALNNSRKAKPKAKPKAEPAPEPKADEPKAPESAKEAPVAPAPLEVPKGSPAKPAEPKKPKDEHEILDGVIPDLEVPEPKAPAAPEPESEKTEPAKGDETPKDKKPGKAKGPKPQRREPSKEELAAMRVDIVTNFPPDVGVALLSLHPDDYQRVKAQAAVHAQVPVQLDKLDEHVAQLTGKGLFQLDPAKVPAPKQARNAHGQMVPFEALKPEEQQEAWAQYRNEIVAASLGLHQQVATAYRKSGAPSDLAVMLTKAKLRGEAPDAFEAVLEDGGSDRLDPKARLKFLSKLQDPKEKALATRYFQGQDYLDVRDEFLDPSKENGVSEHTPARGIAQSLQMGSAMLEERAKAYPEEFRDPAIGVLFRHRVLRRLEALDPAKAVIVQRAVDEMDADDYDKARKVWEKAHRDALRELKKRDEQRDKIELKFFEDQHKAEQDTTYRKAPKPLKSLEERWAEKGLSREEDPELPVEPVKPPRYDFIRGEPPRAKNQYNDLLQQAEEPYVEVKDEDIELEEPKPKKGPSKPPPKKPKKQASADLRVACRVVGRFLAFSTCAT